MAQKKKTLVARIPKAQKRSGKAGIPAYIRAEGGLELDKEDRELIRERLDAKLRRYARSVERISVRLRDVNGPRGGVDVRCRIKVVLSDLPSVVVEKQAATFRPALTGALSAADRTLRRTLQRRRERPVRNR